jgi:kynureninase
MRDEIAPAQGAFGFQLSNPPVLTTAALRASVDIHDTAGMPRLRSKSLRLTAYLELLLNQTLIPQGHLRILTPADPARRGCQLSLRFAKPGRLVHAAVEAQGVICDFREPDVMRIAPVPLYNSFQDVFDFCRILTTAVAE